MVAHSTQHHTFKALHTNQLEFILGQSINTIYNIRNEFSIVGELHEYIRGKLRHHKK